MRKANKDRKYVVRLNLTVAEMDRVALALRWFSNKSEADRQNPKVCRNVEAMMNKEQYIAVCDKVEKTIEKKISKIR